MPKADFNIANVIPEDHGLWKIRQDLLAEPRARQWVICEVVNHHTGIDHPEEDRDQHRPMLRLVSIEAVTDTAHLDQLAKIRDEERLARPGQGSFDEEEHATAGASDGAEG